MTTRDYVETKVKLSIFGDVITTHDGAGKPEFDVQDAGISINGHDYLIDRDWAEIINRLEEILIAYNQRHPGEDFDMRQFEFKLQDEEYVR